MTTIDEPAVTPILEGGTVESEGSALRVFLRTFVENKLAVAGVILLVALVLFSWGGPVVYHFSNGQLILPDGLKGTNASPGPARPLGTDGSGNDILGRLMKGGQISLEIGFIVGLVSTVFGLIVGAISGFFGKWLDVVLMRIVDIGFSIPIVFLVIYIAAVERQTTETLLIIILSVISWLVPARLIRGEALSLRTREYVQAMRTMGGGSVRAIVRHIIPNSIGTIAVTVTFQIADAIILLSTLQYFGFGLPPSIPTWGGDALRRHRGQLGSLATATGGRSIPAGIMIILAVISVNFIGDALRDSFRGQVAEAMSSQDSPAGRTGTLADDRFSQPVIELENLHTDIRLAALSTVQAVDGVSFSGAPGGRPSAWSGSRAAARR